MGIEPKKLTLVNSRPEDVPTGENDIYVQHTNGRRYKKQQKHVNALKKQLRTGYTPNDAA